MRMIHPRLHFRYSKDLSMRQTLADNGVRLIRMLLQPLNDLRVGCLVLNQKHVATREQLKLTVRNLIGHGLHIVYRGNTIKLTPCQQDRMLNPT